MTRYGSAYLKGEVDIWGLTRCSDRYRCGLRFVVGVIVELADVIESVAGGTGPNLVSSGGQAKYGVAAI